MRPLRDTTPGKLHLISIRTDNEFLRLVPNEDLNEILGGIVARYQEKFDITLFGLNFLADHYHLLSCSNQGKISEFAENVDREVAKGVNRYLGRKGHFWGRRYDDLIVITEIDAVEGLLYILTNPVHHGLIKDPAHWPGLSSYFQNLGRPDRKYYFTNWTEYNKARQKAVRLGEFVRLRDHQTEHTLRISVLPQFEHLSIEERTKKIKKLIQIKCAEIHEKRLKQGKTSYLGRKSILAQSSNDRAIKPSKSNRPWFYSRDLEAMKNAKTQEKIRRAEYEEASKAFRAGYFHVVFPEYSFRPPSHRKPKNYTPPLSQFLKAKENSQLIYA